VQAEAIWQNMASFTHPLYSNKRFHGRGCCGLRQILVLDG
jgi:hypothetical protein